MSRIYKLAPYERVNVTRNITLCTNCLGSKHQTINSKSTGCRKSSRKHHTLLHFTNTHKNCTPTDNVKVLTESIENGNVTAPTIGPTAAYVRDTEVLLGITRIKILDKHNYGHECRILINPCSQTNLQKRHTIFIICHFS